MTFGKTLLPLLLSTSLTLSSYGKEMVHSNDTTVQRKLNIAEDDGKKQLYTLLTLIEMKLGGCSPEVILTALKGKKLDTLQFPDNISGLVDFLYANGIAIDQGGCFAVIDTVIQSDISGRKNMLDIMYGEGKHPSGDLLKPTTYIIDLGKNPMDFKAWTAKLNNVRRIHIDKGYRNAMGDKKNNSFVANEFLHYVVDMGEFDLKNAIDHCWSEQMQITYDIVLSSDRDPTALPSITMYFEQYASTALCLQDIDTQEERKEILSGIEDAMIKAFSGVAFNNYLLEGSLMLQILGRQFPQVPQYQSEDAFVGYAMQKVQERDNFDQLHQDILSLDISLIKHIFAEKFLEVKKYGMKFRTQLK